MSDILPYKEEGPISSLNESSSSQSNQTKRPTVHRKNTSKLSVGKGLYLYLIIFKIITYFMMMNIYIFYDEYIYIYIYIIFT